MKWIRKLLGTNYPDPKKGQVWASGHNGALMRVEDISISDGGGVTVYISYWRPEDMWGPGAWGISTEYVHGIGYKHAYRRWRLKMREERRLPARDPTDTHFHLQRRSRIFTG